LELKEALVEQETIEKSDKSDSDETDSPHSLENKSSHASSGKLHEHSSKKIETIENSSSDDDLAAVQGFHFVDMSVLGQIFRLLLCPLCKKNQVEFEEDGDGKMGFATLMILNCTGKNVNSWRSFILL